MRKLSTRHIEILAAGAVLLAACGCSRSKLAVGAMVPILENSKTAALASDDVRMFYAAAPSNLFLIEGLIETDPKNRALRESAAMVYFSYALAYVEDDPVYASSLYERGYNHGKTVLLWNKKVAEVWNKPFSEFEPSLQNLKSKDVSAMVWAVANRSQFISLHLDSTRLLTKIPRVNALLARAMELDPEFFEGLPYMIQGSLYAFVPPMMGGNAEKAQENFQKAFDLTGGQFLLAKYFYALFYCYRVQDPDLFDMTLNEVLAQPPDALPEYRLLNTIAKQKSRSLIEEKDDLF
jgi:tetratricopeptide (TPR) repeat protein